MASEPLPPGHVLIRVEDLAALLAERPAADAPAAASGDAGMTWPALTAAVALITDKLSGTRADPDALIGDVPASAVLRVLVILAAGLGSALPPASVTGALRDLALYAAGQTSGLGHQGRHQ
jgi:hypothetical protein